jgi:hypothetical protein
MEEPHGGRGDRAEESGPEREDSCNVEIMTSSLLSFFASFICLLGWYLGTRGSGARYMDLGAIPIPSYDDEILGITVLYRITVLW